MAHGEIDHGKEPIRLFQSDFLEFFSHVHPAAVLIIWAPVALIFLAAGIMNWPAGAPAFLFPLAFLLGLAMWTLAEYLLHRFLFHFRPRTPAQERISFLFHGVHHAQPMSPTRLVMPPPVSIPLAALFYLLYWGFFSLILGAGHWTAPTFAGFAAGYIAYDMLHYSTHHYKGKGFLRSLKIYHMGHHFKNPNKRFGVSSPFWDHVFGTTD